MAWQKINLKVPKDLDPTQRLRLADLVIEHIVDRTQRGLDKDGNPFPRYSKAYIKSLDFKNAGKSPSRVDLQLSGDMLAALKLINQQSGNLLIGFENSTLENDKAEGNILGTYGGAPTGKKRNFLGIEATKLRELVSFIKQPTPEDEISSGSSEEA